jgi:N-acetylneuraminic acid mutarotase
MQQINNSMKYFSPIISLCLLAAVSSFLSSCNSSSSSSTTTKNGCWDKKADFGGVTRSNAVSFVIDNKAYVVGGINTTNTSVRLSDIRQYDPAKDTWISSFAPQVPLAPFPGAPRSNAVAFAIGGKGYVGTGIDINQARLKDFYEYNPTTNTWKKIADFADGTSDAARYGCVAFSVSGRGFVGGGTNGNTQSDIWEYIANEDKWVQRASMAGKRVNSFSFVIDNNAYVLGGTGTSSQEKRVEKYDPATDQWMQKLSLNKKDENGNTIEQPLPRDFASTFTIDGYAYIIGGSSSNSLFGDTWQYNPAIDRWVEFYGLNKEASSRDGAVSFAINGNGYISTGRGGSSSKLEDTWVFIPSCNEDGKENGL